MNPWVRVIFLSALAAACTALPGCAADHSAIYQNANGTVQRLSVGPWGEFDTRTAPHAFGGNGTFGANASQYRWVHLQGITKVDRDTYVQTVARVPDQVRKLEAGDIVDVVFLTIADTNFDQLKSAVVLRVVCPTDGGTECRRNLYAAEGRYYFGPTSEPVPDMGQYTFSKYYDEDGKILSGVTLPRQTGKD
jgi:hypothetical protein